MDQVLNYNYNNREKRMGLKKREGRKGQSQ